MIRLYFPAILFTGWMGVCAAPSYAEPTLTLPSVTAAPGDTIALSLQLNAEAQNVSAVAVQLDAATVAPASPALTVAPLTAENLPPSLADGLFSSNSVSAVFYAAVAHGEPVNGPMNVMTLTVTLPAGATPGAVYTLSGAAQLHDPDGRPIPVKVENGKLTVQGGTVRRGDVNADGSITVADAVATLQVIVDLLPSTPERTQAADVNGDTAVNVADAILILRHIVGLAEL